MTVSVSKTANQWIAADRSHSRAGVIINGLRWDILIVHKTQKSAVIQGDGVQEGSRLFKVRVAKITPQVNGKSWAVLIKRK